MQRYLLVLLAQARVISFGRGRNTVLGAWHEFCRTAIYVLRMITLLVKTPRWRTREAPASICKRQLRTDGGVRGAPVHKSLGKDCVPGIVHDLLFAVIRAVTIGQTLLAVYLRGWDTLRLFFGGIYARPSHNSTSSIDCEKSRNKCCCSSVLVCFHVCRCRRLEIR